MYSLTCRFNARPTAAVWDLVSGLLYQFHSQGIEEGEEPPPTGDRSLVAANEFELALEPGVLLPPERFTAYFSNLRDLERAQRAITTVIAHLEPVYSAQELADKNYAELWKENFHPLNVPPFWLVRAPWHERPKPDKKTKELIIEPGMAFGTGSHETTRACLELLARAGKASKAKPGPDSKALDFGCGSGILAIALKKLGFGQVFAVDIDPLAVEATQQNAALNSVVVQTGLEVRDLPPMDGIVANILKNTLLDHAARFKAWLKPGGFLILSGLLEDQEAAIVERYTGFGFAVEERLCQNGWVSLWLS